MFVRHPDLIQGASLPVIFNNVDWALKHALFSNVVAFILKNKPLVRVFDRSSGVTFDLVLGDYRIYLKPVGLTAPHGIRVELTYLYSKEDHKLISVYTDVVNYAGVAVGFSTYVEIMAKIQLFGNEFDYFSHLREELFK